MIDVLCSKNPWKLDISCWSVCLRLGSGWIESRFFLYVTTWKNVGWTFFGGGKSWPNKCALAVGVGERFWNMIDSEFTFFFFGFIAIQLGNETTTSWVLVHLPLGHFFFNWTIHPHETCSHSAIQPPLATSYGNWEVQIPRVVSFFRRFCWCVCHLRPLPPFSPQGRSTRWLFASSVRRSDAASQKWQFFLEKQNDVPKDKGPSASISNIYMCFSFFGGGFWSIGFRCCGFRWDIWSNVMISACKV